MIVIMYKFMPRDFSYFQGRGFLSVDIHQDRVVVYFISDCCRQTSGFSVCVVVFFCVFFSALTVAENMPIFFTRYLI